MPLLAFVCQLAYGQERSNVPADHDTRDPAGKQVSAAPSKVPLPDRKALPPTCVAMPSLSLGPLFPAADGMGLYKYGWTSVSGIPSLHRGEYNVAGDIARFTNGSLYGSGRQENVIGLGVMNFAKVGGRYAPNERWKLEAEVYALKLRFARHSSNTFGTTGRMSWQLSPRVGLNAFGTYFATPSFGASGYGYGGYLSFDVASHWQMDVGMQHVVESPSNQRWTVPILRPSYKWKKRRVEADFGGIVQQVIRSLFFNQ